MDWKDGLTAAAIVGVGLFGVKTIRERNYRNHLVNKFGVRNAESFSAGDLAEPEWVSRQRDGAESKCFDCGLVREGGQFCPCSNRAESFSAESKCEHKNWSIYDYVTEGSHSRYGFQKGSPKHRGLNATAQIICTDCGDHFALLRFNDGGVSRLPTDWFVAESFSLERVIPSPDRCYNHKTCGGYRVQETFLCWPCHGIEADIRIANRNEAESFSAEEPKSKVCRECGDPATHTCEHSYDNDPDGWCKADYCDEDWDTMNEGGSHYWDCNHCDGEGEIPSRWVEDGGDRWNPPSLEVRAWEECEYCDEGKICPEADVPIFEFEAESFAADSISICGVCSVAGHRHCGQTTGCPCCEIRVKKESQRPTCGDCGKLKSSSPQEYSQWTCWPCVESAGGGSHGTECYCSQCMSYENYAESFSADEDMLPVGTLVRSYDFGFPAGDGDKPTVDISCYKEGIIEKIAPSPRCSPNCMHYHIKATKTVWSGKEDKDWLDDFMTHPSPNIRSVAEWDSMNGVEDAEVEFYTRKGGQVYQSTPFGLDEFSAESFSAERNGHEVKQVSPDRMYGNTSLQGYVITTRSNLRKAFGNPNMGASGDGKVKSSGWVVEIDGTLCTIYDWRDASIKQGLKRFNVGGEHQKGAHQKVGLALGAKAVGSTEYDETTGIYNDRNSKHFDPALYDAESHAYSYAYNDGHSDARKREEYRPNLSGARQEADFKRIMKQKGD